MSDFLNPIAELNSIDSGEIVTPEVAYYMDKSQKFYCPDYDCKDSERILFPKKSVNDKYFFSHRGKFTHNILPETLLHKLAIKWFDNKELFEIPSYSSKGKKFNRTTLKLDTDKTELEYSKLKTIIPDVKLCSINGFEFAIEIVVTSDINTDKKKLIEEFKLPTIRIDLSKFYQANKTVCRTDKKFIESNLNQLLTNIELKKWVINPSIDSLPEEIQLTEIPIKPNQGCLLSLLVCIIISVLLLFL